MCEWKRYRWAEFDLAVIHWCGNLPLMSWLHPENTFSVFYDVRSRDLRVLATAGWAFPAAEILTAGFDPDKTFFSFLIRNWHTHKSGARVMLDRRQVVVEVAP